MNNSSVDVVNWFVYVSYPQDKQWYFYMTGLFVSVIFILVSVILFLSAKSKGGVDSFISLAKCLVVIQLMEIANYWLYFGQNDAFLFMQAATLIYVVFKNVITNSYGTKPKAKYNESEF